MKTLLCFLPICVLVLSALNEVSAQTRGNQVSCETIGVESWTHVGPQKTCYIKYHTWINSTGCTIATTRETTTGLSFWESKKIHFFPVKVAESFPNLVTYGASGCSVRTISKENFKGLGKMRRLDISHNLIESVPSDAFDDCYALEWLQMAGNKINFIDGASFARLNRLQKVALIDNVCINQNFEDPTSIATLPDVVSKQCQAPVESRISFDSNTQDELLAELYRCKTTVELIREIIKPKDDQLPIQKTEDMRQSEKLLVIIQKRNEEITEKNARIKALEMKVKALEG